MSPRRSARPEWQSWPGTGIFRSPGPAGIGRGALLHCQHQTTATSRSDTLRPPLPALLLVAAWAAGPAAGEPAPGSCFQRHVIDASGSGADGVHLADINGDGFADVVSAWEESAELKLYLHPGPAVRNVPPPWPAVDVRGGENLASAEDAAFADLDADGIPDAVLSATEGDIASPNRRIRLHYRDPAQPLDAPAAWRGSVVGEDTPTERYMKVRAAQLDGAHGADIVAASRDLFEDPDKPGEISRPGGIFLFHAPPAHRLHEPGAWERRRLADVHKGKSIELLDMDADGDTDILYSGARKIFWLENPGAEDPRGDWASHRVGTGSDLALCDLTGDGITDIVATASSKEFPMIARWFERPADGRRGRGRWPERRIYLRGEMPSRFYQPQDFALKSIACLPSNAGHPLRLAVTTSGSGYGIFTLTPPAGFAADEESGWRPEALTDYEWVMKYDNIIAADVDRDGDTDLVTSEENTGFLFRGAGVLWYENRACP